MQNQSHNHNVLDTNRISSLLMKLSAPMFFGLLVQNMYQIVDIIFVSRYVGFEGLAAISMIMPIQMLTMGAGNMVSIGGASLISRLIGEKEKPRAERALGNSIFFAILFSVIVTLIIVPFVGFWLRLIGASETVFPFAHDYLLIVMSGTIFNITGAVMLAMARAEGNARVSMISMLIQSILNVVLDAVFIIWMKMGISGAALAMVISQGIALISVLRYYFIGESYLKLRWRNFLPDGKVVKDIFAIGISQFLKTIVDALSALIIIKMVARYGGDIGLSAFGIIQRIMMFSSMPGMVLGNAMQPVLGFNYGAKRFHNALKTIYIAVGAATLFGVIALLVLVIFPEPIIGIFTSDPDLIAACTFAARLMFLGLPVFGFFNVAQLVFPSIGKAMATFIISVLRPLAIITPLALILPRFLQMSGVWLIFPFADVLALGLILVFLIPLIKKFRKSARESEPAANTAVPQLDTDASIV